MPEPPVASWHPMLALQEREPGHWVLVAQFGQYGDITLVRRDGEVGYRALVLPVRGTAPIEVAFARTLREATELVHKHWLASHALDADRRPSNY